MRAAPSIESPRPVQLLEKPREKLRWIDFEHARKLDEFDDIHAPLARLNAPHEGTRSIKTVRQLTLVQPGRFTSGHQYSNQDTMPAAAEGLS